MTSGHGALLAALLLFLAGCDSPGRWSVPGSSLMPNVTNPGEVVVYEGMGGPRGVPLGGWNHHRGLRVDVLSGAVRGESATLGEIPFAADEVFGWRDEFVVVDWGSEHRCAKVLRSPDVFSRSAEVQAVTVPETVVGLSGEQRRNAFQFVEPAERLVFLPASSDGPFEFHVVDLARMQLTTHKVSHGARDACYVAGLVLTRDEGAISAYSTDGALVWRQPETDPTEAFVRPATQFLVRPTGRVVTKVDRLETQSIDLIVRRREDGVPALRLTLEGVKFLTWAGECADYIVAAGRTNDAFVVTQGDPLEAWIVWNRQGVQIAEGRTVYDTCALRGYSGGFLWSCAVDEEAGRLVVGPAMQAVVIHDGNVEGRLAALQGTPCLLRSGTLVCRNEDRKQVLGVPLSSIGRLP